MVKDMVVFVEGDPRLREGFDFLFSAHLKGKKVFNLSKGKSDAIKKFKLEKKSEAKYLLIDLDAGNTERGTDLKSNTLVEEKDSVHYMIQEMEAWFLSQPQILDSYYNLKISDELQSKYGNAHADSIGNPKSKLKDFIKNAVKHNKVVEVGKRNKTNYDEVGDAVILLKKLNLTQLSEKFKDVMELIAKLDK